MERHAQKAPEGGSGKLSWGATSVTNPIGATRPKAGRWTGAEARSPAGLFGNDCCREQPWVSTLPVALA